MLFPGKDSNLDPTVQSRVSCLIRLPGMDGPANPVSRGITFPFGIF